jgi:hypothetical protein
VLELVLQTRHLPQTLAQKGTVTVTAEEVAQRIGQVFIQRVRAGRVARVTACGACQEGELHLEVGRAYAWLQAAANATLPAMPTDCVQHLVHVCACVCVCACVRVCVCVWLQSAVNLLSSTLGAWRMIAGVGMLVSLTGCMPWAWLLHCALRAAARCERCPCTLTPPHARCAGTPEFFWQAPDSLQVRASCWCSLPPVLHVHGQPVARTRR